MTVPRADPTAGRTPRRPRKAHSLRLAALPLAAVLLGSGGPSGPLHLAVSDDHVSGVITIVTWKKDGRPVTRPVALTYVAEPASGGPRVGPIRMMSVGNSLYISQRPLPKGIWRVTVTATTPVKTSATKIITLNGASTYTPDPHDAMHNGHAHPDSSPAHSEHAHSGGTPVRALVAGAAAMITLIAAAMRWRTRRRAADGK